MAGWHTFIVGLLAAVSVASVLRMRRQGGPHRGWVVVLGAIMALAIAGEVLERHWLVGVALATWGLLVWLPSVLAMVTRQLALRERYGAAVACARVSALLHPCDGWEEVPTYLRAFAKARAGDLEGAVEGLERLCRPGAAFAPRARLHASRLRQRWDEIVALARENPDQTARDGELSAMTLRALGETGDTAGMVDMFAGRRAAGHRPPPHLRDSERLALFAFGGRPDDVRRVLAQGFGPLPAIARDFWIATARHAAGDSAGARAEFERLLESAEPPWADILRRRLELPPAAPLDERRAAVVAAEAAACETEARYGGTTSLFSPTALITRLLIVANLAVFAIEIWQGGSTDFPTLMRLGGLSTDRVLAGEWWRLPAATFLHYGPFHLAMNVLALGLLGPAAESQLGRGRFLAIYLLSGIGAMAACTLEAFSTGSRLFVVGASGSVMGIVGAGAAIMLRGWLRDRARAARNRGAVMLGYVIAQMAIDSMVPLFSFTSHLAGAAIGFLLALLLGDRLGRPDVPDG